MSIITFSIRMEQSKSLFDNLCADFGMNASTAFNIFARAVVRERKIPFDIYSPAITREKVMETFLALREEAKRNGLQDMTLEEINEEIHQARLEAEGSLYALCCH